MAPWPGDLSRRDAFKVGGGVLLALALAELGCNLPVVTEGKRKKDAEEEEMVRTGEFKDVVKRPEVMARVLRAQILKLTGVEPRTEKIDFVSGADFLKAVQQIYVQKGFEVVEVDEETAKGFIAGVPAVAEVGGGTIYLNSDAGVFGGGLVTNRPEMNKLTSRLAGGLMLTEGLSRLKTASGERELGEEFPDLRVRYRYGLELIGSLGETETSQMEMYGLQEGVGEWCVRALTKQMGMKFLRENGEEYDPAELNIAGTNAAAWFVGRASKMFGWGASDWAGWVAGNNPAKWWERADEEVAKMGDPVPQTLSGSVGRALYMATQLVADGVMPPGRFVAVVSRLLPEGVGTPEPSPTPSSGRIMDYRFGVYGRRTAQLAGLGKRV